MIRSDQDGTRELRPRAYLHALDLIESAISSVHNINPITDQELQQAKTDVRQAIVQLRSIAYAEDDNTEPS